MIGLVMNTPFGAVTLFDDTDALVALEWGQGSAAAKAAPSPLLAEAKAQLDAYFDGRLRAFDLPLAPPGTPYRHRVWDALSEIPWGETRTYGHVAAALASAPRAVGHACRHNLIPIIVPCHRVLAADGRLGGYSGVGGLSTKTALLRLEGRTV